MSTQNAKKELSFNERMIIARTYYLTSPYLAPAFDTNEEMETAMDNAGVPKYVEDLSEEVKARIEKEIGRPFEESKEFDSGENFKHMHAALQSEHHMRMPSGPEGYLIAHHLFEALKGQGVSIQLEDGTFVFPEVLAEVLRGPEGFGDWKSTKFVLVLPVTEPIKTKSDELNALQEEAAQAAIALEEAQQRAAETINRLNEAKGVGKVLPGISDYTAGQSQSIGSSFANGDQSNTMGSRSILANMPAIRAVFEVREDRRGFMFQFKVTELEVASFMAAMEAGVKIIIAADGSGSYPSQIALPLNPLFKDTLMWEKGYKPSWSNDISPEEADRLMKSYQNIQSQSTPSFSVLTGVAAELEKMTVEKLALGISQIGVDTVANSFGLNDVESRAFEEIVKGSRVRFLNATTYAISDVPPLLTDDSVLSAITWDENHYTPTWCRDQKPQQ